MNPLKSYGIACILLCACAVARGQQPLERKNSLRGGAIADLEKASYERSLRTVSVASNNFDVYYYRCEWTVDPAVRYIKGTVTVYFTITAAAGSLVLDMDKALSADSVLFHSSRLLTQQGSDNSLAIVLPASLPAGRQDSLTVWYQGVPPASGFGSFVTSTQNGVPVMWTLSEPYGAKDWWPCRNAQSDKADSLDVVLHFPDRYSSASNGLLVNETSANGTRTASWKHRFPISSYLVAFAITNFVTEKDSVTAGNTRIPVLMHAYAGSEAYYRSATDVAKKCLQLFSRLFGLYPFAREGYSQTQFGWGGGMEHQTNSFISSNYDQLIAHELSHQWFGDKVTCRNWTDTWLNEGFAAYMQILYLENFATDQKADALTTLRAQIVSRQDGSVRVQDTSNVGRIFDGRLTYDKGAYLLHMIRWKLGDSLFFRALRNYLQDPLLAYGTAATPDLQRHLQAVSGQNFGLFFRSWYEGEGYPSYHVQWSQNLNHFITLRIGQTTSHPSVSFYAMPVPLLLRGSGRDSLVVLDHSRDGQAFLVNTGFTVDTIIFDPAAWLLSGYNTVSKTGPVSAAANDVRLYPNPATEFVSVVVANPTGSRIEIKLYDAAARLVYRRSQVISGTDVTISLPLTGLAAGTYRVEARGDNGFRQTRSFIKGTTR